jgi:hypothetical protein
VEKVLEITCDDVMGLSPGLVFVAKALTWSAGCCGNRGFKIAMLTSGCVPRSYDNTKYVIVTTHPPISKGHISTAPFLSTRLDIIQVPNKQLCN